MVEIKNKPILLALLFLGIAGNLFSQDTLSSKKEMLIQSSIEGDAKKINKMDSSAIESFVHKFVVKLNLDTRTDTYTILNRADGSEVSIGTYGQGPSGPTTNYCEHLR